LGQGIDLRVGAIYIQTNIQATSIEGVEDSSLTPLASSKQCKELSKMKGLTSKYYAHLQPDALGAQVEMLMPLMGSFVAAGVALASSVTGDMTTLPPSTWQVSKPHN
jgi:hypothetical protein